MNKTDLAYAAGIFDGEGHIGITRHSNGSLSVKVQIGNTNEWLLQWFKFALGGRVMLQNDRRAEKLGWKPIYHWYLRADEIQDFLKIIYPYLKIKKAQAEIVINLMNTRGKKGRWFNENEKAVAEAQRIAISKLNKVKAN